jgi:hypothetical protein
MQPPKRGRAFMRAIEDQPTKIGFATARLLTAEDDFARWH